MYTYNIEKHCKNVPSTKQQSMNHKHEYMMRVYHWNFSEIVDPKKYDSATIMRLVIINLEY